MGGTGFMTDDSISEMNPANNQLDMGMIHGDDSPSVMPEILNVFRPDSSCDRYERDRIRRHKLWLDTLIHEYPLPYAQYRIGVYIRFLIKQSMRTISIITSSNSATRFPYVRIGSW